MLNFSLCQSRKWKVDTQIFILSELKWKVGLENEKKNISYDAKEYTHRHKVNQGEGPAAGEAPEGGRFRSGARGLVSGRKITFHFQNLKK